MRSVGAAPSNVVGVDIGGANLKYYASANGQAVSKRFPMWLRSATLAETLTVDLACFPTIDSLAVTMTGELADCFEDRSVGVRTIVDQVVVAASRLGIADVGFYGTDGAFHSAPAAKSMVDIVAAANWHALATLVASQFESATTVIDIGSTTTDIIPISAGRVTTSATSDHQRLIEGSLVYVGCRRTPVCALIGRLHFAGQACPVINELFATIDDARLLMETSGEDPQDLDTADKRPRTIECAANRIARMIGLDRRTVSIDQAKGLASQIVEAAAARIAAAFQRIHLPGPVVVAGHGADLLRLHPAVQIDRLSDQLGDAASRCAPSYAVALLYDRTTNGDAKRCGA